MLDSYVQHRDRDSTRARANKTKRGETSLYDDRGRSTKNMQPDSRIPSLVALGPQRAALALTNHHRERLQDHPYDHEVSSHVYETAPRYNRTAFAMAASLAACFNRRVRSELLGDADVTLGADDAALLIQIETLSAPSPGDRSSPVGVDQTLAELEWLARHKAEALKVVSATRYMAQLLVRVIEACPPGDARGLFPDERARPPTEVYGLRAACHNLDRTYMSLAQAPLGMDHSGDGTVPPACSNSSLENFALVQRAACLVTCAVGIIDDWARRDIQAEYAKRGHGASPSVGVRPGKAPMKIVPHRQPSRSSEDDIASDLADLFKIVRVTSSPRGPAPRRGIEKRAVALQKSTVALMRINANLARFVAGEQEQRADHLTRRAAMLERGLRGGPSSSSSSFSFPLYSPPAPRPGSPLVPHRTSVVLEDQPMPTRMASA